MILDVQKYLSRKVTHRNSGYKDQASCYRNWWLVKARSDTSYYVNIGRTLVALPKEYWGKKVRFKMEIMEDK